MLKKENLLQYGLHAVILTGVVLAAVRYLNGAAVWQALRTFQYQFAPLMLLFSAGFLLFKAINFVIFMRPYAELPWLPVAKAFIAGQAGTLLPGGVAVRAGLMKQLGVPIGYSGVPVALSSAVDQVFFLITSLIVSFWFPDARQPVLIILGVLVVITAVLGIRPARHALINGSLRLAERLKFRDQWQDFLDAMPRVFTWPIMAKTAVLTLLAMACMIIPLDFAVRGVGEPIPTFSLILAFVLPTMLGRIFPLPAGIGVTEAGMVGFLTATSQIDPNVATAAVAIYRIATILFQALLGALVYFFWWDGEQELASKMIQR